MTEQPFNLDTALQAGKDIAAANGKVITIDDQTQFLALPSNFTLHRLAQKRKDAPESTKQTTVLNDGTSFVEYVKRFKTDQSLIFANKNARTMWAVIDFHGKDKPSWAEHKARLDLVSSEEWKAWTGINKKPLAQSAFAEFLELNMSDVVTPDPLKLYDLAQFLTATIDVSIVAAKRQRDGQLQMTAKENVNLSGPDADFSIPEKILLNLRPFAGCVTVPVEAWLRIRIPRQGGEATFEIQLQRTADILEAAFADIVETIGMGTGIPALCGDFNG